MTHIPLASRWSALAVESASAIARTTDDGFVSEPETLARLLADSELLGTTLSEAVGRGFPVDHAMILAAESLLRAVIGVQPVLVAREVERVLQALDGDEVPEDELLTPSRVFSAASAVEGALTVAYPRFFETRTAA